LVKSSVAAVASEVLGLQMGVGVASGGGATPISPALPLEPVADPAPELPEPFVPLVEPPLPEPTPAPELPALALFPGGDEPPQAIAAATRKCGVPESNLFKLIFHPFQAGRVIAFRALWTR
jgi:hypothetical protein